MTRFVRMLVLALAVLVTSMATVGAQGTLTITEQHEYVELVGPRNYTIVEGDSLWELTPTEWRLLQAANPKLSDPSRIGTTRNGLYRVHLNVNEVIEIPAGLRIWMRVPRQSNLNETPVAPPAPQAPANNQSETKPATPPTEASGFNWWMILVGLGILALVLYALRNLLPESRRPDLPALGRLNPALTTNPVTAVPPMTPGGIDPENHAAIRNQLVEQTARAYAETHGGIMPPLESIRIVGPIVPGRMHDVWRVRDARGRWTHRRFNGERGFQAPVSINNAEPTLQTFSQECGNDLRYAGMRYQGGRFVPESQTQAIPATEPQRPAAALHAVPNETGSSATVVWNGMEYTVRNGILRVELDKKTGQITGFEANGHVRTSKVAKPVRAAEPRTGTDQ